MTAHSDAAMRLRFAREAIIASWLAGVRRVLPQAAVCTDDLVIDNLPAFLDGLESALQGRAEGPGDVSAACEEHGRQRAALEVYDLDAVIREHRLLRHVLLEEMEREGPLPREVRLAIHDGVDQGIQTAAACFSGMRLEAASLAGRRKDEFLTLLAHEIRNPLFALRNALELLRLLPGDDPRVAATLALAGRQTEQLDRLAADLTDLEGIGRGGLHMRMEALDLRVPVEAAAEAARFQAEARSQQLRLDLPPDPVSVRGDRGRLQQVVANLLSNAVRYSAPGGETRIALECDGDACLRVCDQGEGMGPEQLAGLFSMEEGRPRQMSGRGLGVGLLLVRRLVELHGGSVRAESDGPGRGSVFTVRLPLDPGPERDGS